MGKAALIHSSHPLGGGRDLVNSAQHQLLIQLGFGIMIAEIFLKVKAVNCIQLRISAAQNESICFNDWPKRAHFASF